MANTRETAVTPPIRDRINRRLKRILIPPLQCLCLITLSLVFWRLASNLISAPQPAAAGGCGKNFSKVDKLQVFRCKSGICQLLVFAHFNQRVEVQSPHSVEPGYKSDAVHYNKGMSRCPCNARPGLFGSD